jgi:hypothetical protein
MIIVSIRVFLVLMTLFCFPVVANKDVKISPSAIHEAAHYVYFILSKNPPSLISKIEIGSRLVGRNHIDNQFPIKNISAVYMAGHYFHWLVVHKKQELNNEEFKVFLDYYQSTSEYKDHVKSLSKTKPPKNIRFNDFVNTELLWGKAFIEIRFKIAFPKILRTAKYLDEFKFISGSDALKLVTLSTI